MQKYLFLLYPCVLFLTQSYAQNILTSQRGSFFTYIYQIEEQEAENLYEGSMGRLNELYFHTLVDSFPTNDIYNKSLIDGHYLFVKAVGNKLSCELKTFSKYRIHYLNNQRDFALVIHDDKGGLISTAEVEMRNRKVYFDEVSKSYRLVRYKKDGLLKVKINEQILYEHIAARTNHYGRRRRGFFYKVPIRLLWKPAVDFIKSPIFSIRSSYPQGWVRWFANIFDPVYREEYRERRDSRRYQGYLAFNQPMYKPRDTVKFKAFITQKGKKLYKKPIQAYWGTYYDNDPQLITEIHPYHEGGYSSEFVLYDSLDLQLDRFYSVSLKNGKKTLLTNRFKYEDYELMENTFELRVANETHKKGIKQKLYLSGKDENDLNLLDAQVELFILTEVVDSIIENEVFIPDTLWTHQQKLDEVGETYIEIPDSIFPNAYLTYKVLAYFYNTENELHIEEESINYEIVNSWLEISEENDSLLLQYMDAGVSKEKSGVIWGFTADGEQCMKELITLPARLPIKSYVDQYELETEKLAKTYKIIKDQKVSFVYVRNEDFIHIHIQNPLQLDVWYQLYNGNKEILRGADKDFRYKAKASGKNLYTLCWQYMWGGEMLDESLEMIRIENRLDIALEHPNKIYPGQEVEIGISVKNAKGKPMHNVDLTAYGIKSTFPDHDLPNVPAWEKKGKTKVKGFSFHESSGYAINQISKDLSYGNLRKLMKLDSIAYYQFLYPKDGMFRFSYPAPDSLTQFAPFIVREGRLQSVELIYVDNTPVYVGQVGNIQPYSFAVDSGYHKVEIRTPFHWITLDSLFFKPKLKHILSIEADTAKSFIQRKSSTLDEEEMNRILPYLMVVQRNIPSNFSYLKQGKRVFPMVSNYRRRSKSGSILIGPILPQTFTYHHYFDSVFSLTTHFEPRYEYDFQPQLVKMRTFDIQENSVFRFSKFLSGRSHWRTDFRDLLQKEQEIFEQWLAYKASFLPTSNPAQTTSGNGKIRVELNLPDSLQPKMIFILADENPEKFRIYGKLESIFHDFPPNAYDFMYLLTDSSFIYLSNVNVKANGLTYLEIEAPKSQRTESLVNLLQMLITKRLAKKKDFNGDFSPKKSLVPIENEKNYPRIGKRTRGQILDEEGNPLIGASVLLKGSTIGVFTDENGYYDLPATSHSTIVVSYVGFRSRDITIGNQGFIRSNLEPSELRLDEVVVSALGGSTHKESSSLYWLDPFDDLQIRKNLTATVTTIRGFHRLLEKDPLIIVDGIPYDGDVSDLDTNLIGKIETLKGEEAISLYGARGANGVILITSGAGVDLNALAESNLQPQQTYSLRSNFSDYAFWQPNLRTNKEGKASFKTTFPDDITKWQLYAVGMDDKKHSGITGSQIKAFKPIMAQLAMPQFLVEGDSINILGKIQNYSSDTLDASIRMEVNEQLLWEKSAQIQSSLIDTVDYGAGAVGMDSVVFTYKLALADGYMDGEKRQIPIYPKGVMETDGHYFGLYSDTTISVSLEEDVAWTLSAYSDPITVIHNEIKHIRNYRYLCNEQMASKLKALLAEERILNWRGEKFRHKTEIHRLQKRLIKNHQGGELWGWWANSPKDYWVSRHVQDALLEAEVAGYSNGMNGYSTKYKLLKEVQNKANKNRLYSLEMLIKMDSSTNYLKWVNEIGRADTLSFSEQARLNILRQEFHQEVDLDFVFEQQKETLLGNVYWGNETYEVKENAITTTLLVYQLLKQTGKYESLLPRIQAYFFERLENGHWRNTYESAEIISSILPDLIASYQEIEPSKLSISTSFSKKIHQFPFDTIFYATKPLSIQKTGTAPVYLSLFHQNQESNPQQKSDYFLINSTFEGKNVTETNSDKWRVRAGKPIILKVNVEVKKESEYIMVEIPIPSGCSYYSKKQIFNEVETYREYLHDRTSIFCTNISTGHHTFEVELLPRYTGSFTLNPVRVEQMYFPIFEGNNTVHKVSIE